MLRLAACALLFSTMAAWPQNFSCRIGTSPACLDYGDKVCSSRGKCVTSDAVCFDNYTCNYKGFVCKSKLDEVVELHDDIVLQYNSLARDAESARSCVNYASNLEEAQNCVSRLR